MMRSRRSWRLALLAGIVMTTLLLFAMVVLTTPSAATELSWKDLRNAAYPSEFPRAKVAPLIDGFYEEEYVPGAATKLRMRMANMGAFGLLDDDQAQDAAVVLISDPGGSGTFVHLVAVLNRGGKAQPAATVLLGDRVAVRGLRIEGRDIRVRLRVRSSRDPMVKLTKEVDRTYSLAGDKLVLDSETDVPQPRLAMPPDRFLHSPTRIEIPPGTKAATFDGTLKPGGIADYVLRGEAGQPVRFGVKSEFNNAILSVFGMGDTAEVVSRADYATTWSGVFPTSQDYAVKVITVAGHDLAYSLNVERLTGTPPSTPTATVGPAPPPTPTAAAKPTPPTAPSPGPPISALPPGDLNLTDQPLADLFPDAAQFLQTRAPQWSVAVVVPSQNSIYMANGNQQLEMASVVKVVIMLVVIDQATGEGRYVDDDELELLWPMITESDNDSATQLWNQVGGARAVAGYLGRIGISGIAPYDGAYWGTSRASARAMALALARIAFGDLLDQPNRRLALNLLTKVVPSQRFGVTAQAEGRGSHGDTVGLKNGYYLAPEGWRMNSVGVILPAVDADPAYAIAVMTNSQETTSYGIATIEGVATRIHGVLHQ